MHSLTGKQKKELRAIIVSAVLFFVLLITEHGWGEAIGAFLGRIVGMDPAIVKRLLFFALFLVPYMIVGFSVVRKAVLGIGHRQWLDECFLMTLATIGAFATGENAEACAVMLFYQVGEFFQGYAVRRSRGQIRSLMEIVPEVAYVVAEDGSVSEEDPEEIAIGTKILVRPGEKIPLDGVVVDGESMINTAALTGEPVPRHVRSGDAVFSGCVNGEGSLTIRTEKEYEDSTVTRILELVENATEKKSRTENFITRFARVYTPFVVGCAVLLAFVPPIFVGHIGEWIMRACTFLVISCPCALVISVPLSFFGGIGAASRQGILVKGSNYLELLSDVGTLAMDKTGTLTEGVFAVQEILPAEGVSADEVLRLAAQAEAASTHPIADSIREEAEERGVLAESTAVPAMQNVSGEGIIADLTGGRLYVGNAMLMRHADIPYEEARDDGATVVYVAMRDHGAGDGRYLGAILIADRVKASAQLAMQEIRSLGVTRLLMLSGDRSGSARTVGDALGLDDVYCELLPADKVGVLETEIAKNGNRHLAYIGDGINDAPVLARADVGIAMGSLGADAAIEAADVVIMDDELSRVPVAMRIAKKTVRIAKENIVFALVVKALILILGALGLANMWLAVFADVGVAVIAIINAMRCMRG